MVSIIAPIGSGWPDLVKDTAIIADWFDEHLKPHNGETPSPKP